MSEFLQKIRLIPIVLIAAGGLLALKLTGIILDGGYTLGAGHQAMIERAAKDAAKAAAMTALATRPVQVVRQEDPRFPATQEAAGDVTGSVAAKPKDASREAAKGAALETVSSEPKKIQALPARQAPVNGTLVQMDANPISPSERALLERLSERRQELEKRQSELEMRDTLLRAAEKRLETKINDLKDAEARMVTATQQKEDSEKERLRNLVTMYENMKPKDAAKIFDRLDIKLATEVAKMIQPRRMSDIMAQMTPESAQRLTVELAGNNRDDTKPQRPAVGQLPKIEGRQSGSL
jgi:flagellar motility protein MotE (MotC chaperone)